jgi:fatty acid desaturase
MGPYLGAAILVNHMGTRLVDPDAKMPRLLQTIETTRNLRSNRACDYFFGGTNNHIEHHLFPSVPIFRLRDARRITRAFCRREGISYRETTWSRAVKDVFHHLDEMSKTENRKIGVEPID